MDAVVKARLRGLPESRNQRRSLEFMVKRLEPGRTAMSGDVKAANVKVEEMDQDTSKFGSISKEDMNSVKCILWPLDVRETFSYLGLGPEPQLLATLYGDPNPYYLRVFRRFPGSSVVGIGSTYWSNRPISSSGSTRVQVSVGWKDCEHTWKSTTTGVASTSEGI